MSQTYRSISDSEWFERVLDQVTHVFDLAENVKMRRRRVDHVQWIQESVGMTFMFGGVRMLGFGVKGFRV